jgi:hypothetical protein
MAFFAWFWLLELVVYFVFVLVNFLLRDQPSSSTFAVVHVRQVQGMLDSSSILRTIKESGGKRDSLDALRFTSQH